MVIPEQMQDAVHREIADLMLRTVPELFSLRGGAFGVQRHIPQDQTSGPGVDISHGEGEHVRGPVHLPKIPVENVDARVVRQKHGQLAGVFDFLLVQHGLRRLFDAPPEGQRTFLTVFAPDAHFQPRHQLLPFPFGAGTGERLGFLPGDLQSKVDPYLRPLYDALFDMLGAETYNKYLERGDIEVAPLAYMRGRTLDDSFIILDEAQNTSREQMKMFLTRLGFGSKVVITGDVTQIDLPADKVSGLKEAIRVLDGVEDIAICRLTGADVVRHVLVQRIIAAYEKYDQKRQENRSPIPAPKNRGRR